MTQFGVAPVLVVLAFAAGCRNAHLQELPGRYTSPRRGGVKRPTLRESNRMDQEIHVPGHPASPVSFTAATPPGRPNRGILLTCEKSRARSRERRV